MKIHDFAMILPYGLMTTILKMARTEIDTVGKKEILKNGLYHITPSEEVTRKIIESEYLRPSTGIMKNLNSYGTASVCLFNGAPEIDNYIKNLVNKSQDNPYVNPTLAVSAIKLLPQNESELINYKSRDLADNVIIYEGYCILPKNEVQEVHLVPDLVRDKETGEPIINPKTGKYDIAFREANVEELRQDGKNYIAKEDYLKFIEQERKKLGYIKGNNPIANAYNLLISVAHAGNIEGKMVEKNVTTNVPKILKRKINQLMTPKLEMSSDEKIHSTIEEFNYDKKNPYRDKKFGQAVGEFQAQGLEQLNLENELEELTTSNIGGYYRNKYNQIDKDIIVKRGIHNINHNNRVAILSMIIAKNEGLFENDIDNRAKDILLSAAYYHDIGRKKGIITDNFGPHSKNSARKINKIDLTYANGKKYTERDKKILQAVVEAHEGKDKNMDKICRKYQIGEEDIEYTTQMMKIIKDADALDRVRLDLNIPIAMVTDLNPKYLRTNTSKQLLNASYQLEALSKKVPIEGILAYKTDGKQEFPKSAIEEKRDEFMEYLRQGITQAPKVMQNMNKTLKLKKEQIISRFTGNNAIKKIREILIKKENKKEEEFER